MDFVGGVGVVVEHGMWVEVGRGNWVRKVAVCVEGLWSGKNREPFGGERFKKPRMGGDSNPRYLSVNTLSRRAQSTTLPPIHWILLGGDRELSLPN